MEPTTQSSTIDVDTFIKSITGYGNVLEIHNDETKAKLQDTIDFAISVGHFMEFAWCLHSLLNGGSTRRKVVLSWDYAPYSFGFSVRFAQNEKGAPMDMRKADDEVVHTWGGGLVGGVIYDGPGCPNDGSAPAYTVSLASKNRVHEWRCHT